MGMIEKFADADWFQASRRDAAGSRKWGTSRLSPYFPRFSPRLRPSETAERWAARLILGINDFGFDRHATYGESFVIDREVGPLRREPVKPQQFVHRLSQVAMTC